MPFQQCTFLPNFHDLVGRSQTSALDDSDLDDARTDKALLLWCFISMRLKVEMYVSAGAAGPTRISSCGPRYVVAAQFVLIDGRLKSADNSLRLHDRSFYC